MHKNTANRIIVFLLTAVLSFAVTAQDSVKPKKTAEKPVTRKDDAPPIPREADKGGAREVTYLDVVHARDKSLKLKEDNMRDIQLLNTLGAAMAEAVDPAASGQIATEYKEALKLIYRMDYVGAERILRGNRENIGVAMSRASEVFRRKTTDMLNQSADRMADLDMQAESTGSADAIRLAGVVQRNQHRLSVGYQQLTLASTAEKHRRYAEALSHYRLARLHAIYLQIELAKDETEKNALRAQYRNELDEKRLPKELSAEKDASPVAEKKPAGK